jgi:hypothetical protein
LKNVFLILLLSGEIVAVGLSHSQMTVLADLAVLLTVIV